VDIVGNCQICVRTTSNTVHCDYDGSLVQAHNILHNIQLQCGGMRLYPHHVAYTPWRLVEQKIKRSTLKVSSLDLSDLRNYVVVDCKGIFSIALEHKYAHNVESKSRKATSRYMLYPKSQITSTDAVGIKSMRVGFMENNTLHVCDYFALVDGVPMDVKGAGEEFDSRSNHFHLDGLVSILEGDEHWRQIRFGGGSGVRILRLGTSGSAGTFNSDTVKHLLYTLILDACVQFADDNRGRLVLINSPPYTIYEGLTRKAKCIFVEPYVWNSDDDSEWSYSCESRAEMHALQVKSVNSSIRLCEVNIPVVIPWSTVVSEGMSKVFSPLVINLDEFACSWLSGTYLYVGNCRSNDIEHDLLFKSPILGSLREFNLIRTSIHDFISNIAFDVSLPKIICSEGFDTYLAQHL
jgi:hypothetical protein